MPTPSDRLGILIPTTADDFDTAEIAGNWQAIDDSPGRLIVEFASAPVWGAAHIGMEFIDPVTLLVWRWDGVDFLRSNPLGLLGRTNRTSDFTTVSTTPQTVVTVSVDIPEGDREIEIIASWPGASGDDGAVNLAIFRDAASITSWKVVGTTGATLGPDLPAGGSLVFTEANPGAGNYDYSLRVSVPATLTGEVVVEGGAARPAQIVVKEI